MDYIVFVLVSTLEWIALLSIPVVLLGYYYRKYFTTIIILAFIMSVLSMLFRMTSLQVAMIIGIQILILLFLVKLFFRANFIQAFVIMSMGYGFYNFVQMLIIEMVVQALEFQYVQIYFTLPITTTIQLTTAFLMYGLCYCVYYFKLELTELRYLIEDRLISKKYKNILIFICTLMSIFIVLINFVFLTQNFAFKFFTIIVTLILTFVILLTYVILHSQFQVKRLIEAKKFYLDQDQQVATIVKKLSDDYKLHFKAIAKLCESNTTHLIKKYVDENQLEKRASTGGLDTGLRSGIDRLDEMLYALIINKRKLASLLNVSIEVNTEVKDDVRTTLLEVRNLSIILDDLILMLYRLPESQEKSIYFNIKITKQEIIYEISSPFDIREDQSAELQLFDALLRFKKNHVIVQSKLNPVHIRIHFPPIKKAWFDV
ncbi:hypothetical protein ACJ2A9_22995 [Anaerobacillus sp. MEB173]|uniref:hypothetical protein n=1 Tax=Anaerobacillus sp. MEB173 TaxID=3383345 RepID=UPI003F8ED909